MPLIWEIVRRGAGVGLLAGLLAGAFAFVFGEPLVQDTIDIEQARSAQAALTPVVAHVSDWAVGRPEQRMGLFVATALYGLALGTVFAIAFAVLRGRGAQRTDWQLSTRLAAGLFAAIVIVPAIKYPANPPAVGDPDTIVARTWLYLALLAGGVLSLLAAARVMWGMRSDPARPWLRPLAGAATFVALAGFLVLVLPGVAEVPADFPAALLWQFRMSSLGTQAVLWAVLGAGFGILATRAGRTAPAPA